MADTTMAQQNAIHGHIAARIDRLPLTRVQWELAILVEITWGFIIVDTDGIGARLYPIVWRPLGVMTTNQYAVIQALQVGLGVLLGTYLMSFVADKYGRRPAILLSTAARQVCLWPFAFVTDFCRWWCSRCCRRSASAALSRRTRSISPRCRRSRCATRPCSPRRRPPHWSAS